MAADPGITVLSVTHYICSLLAGDHQTVVAEIVLIGYAPLRIKATRNISGHHRAQSDLAFVSATNFTREFTVKVLQCTYNLS